MFLFKKKEAKSDENNQIEDAETYGNNEEEVLKNIRDKLRGPAGQVVPYKNEPKVSSQSSDDSLHEEGESEIDLIDEEDISEEDIENSNEGLEQEVDESIEIDEVAEQEVDESIEIDEVAEQEVDESIEIDEVAEQDADEIEEEAEYVEDVQTEQQADEIEQDVEEENVVDETIEQDVEEENVVDETIEQDVDESIEYDETIEQDADEIGEEAEYVEDVQTEQQADVDDEMEQDDGEFEEDIVDTQDEIDDIILTNARLGAEYKNLAKNNDIDNKYYSGVMENNIVKNDSSNLISETVKQQTQNYIGELLATAKAVKKEQKVYSGVQDITLVDLVSPVVKEYVKTWMDQNLTALVNDIVKAEIKKLLPDEYQ